MEPNSTREAIILRGIGFCILSIVDISLIFAAGLLIFGLIISFQWNVAILVGVLIIFLLALFIFLTRFLLRKEKRIFKRTAIILSSLIIFFIFGFFYLFQPARITGASVAGGKYKEGQIVLGEKITYLFRDPKIGDIVTFTNLKEKRVGQIYDIQKEDAMVVYLVKHDADKDSKLTRDRINSRIYWGLPFKKETELSKGRTLEKKDEIIQYEAPKYDPKNKAFFYRFNGSKNEREGIWVYDFSNNIETQLISFKEMQDVFNSSSNSTVYGSPVISPDLTKIIFYSKSSEKFYNLWLYDLIAGKKQKILKDVILFSGYIQSPIWSSNSKLIYLTFYENGSNKLFSIDLNGNIKKLANSYNGQIFWPKVISDSLLIFYPSLPEGNEIGVLNLKTDKVDIIKTLTSSYLSKIDIFQKDLLIKSSMGPYLSSSGPVDNTDIYSLELLDLKNLKVNKFPIPREIILTPEIKRIQPRVVCGEWVLLESIVKGGDIGEKEDINFYRYNLATKFTESFKIDGEFKYSFLDCANDGSFYTLMRNNKFVFFDLSNPSNNKEYDLSETVGRIIDNSCLYQESFYPKDYLTDQAIYLDLRSGQGCEAFDERAGLYKIYLNQKLMIKISNPKDYDEQDFLLVK